MSSGVLFTDNTTTAAPAGAVVDSVTGETSQISFVTDSSTGDVTLVTSTNGSTTDPDFTGVQPDEITIATSGSGESVVVEVYADGSKNYKMAAAGSGAVASTVTFDATGAVFTDTIYMLSTGDTLNISFAIDANGVLGVSVPADQRTLISDSALILLALSLSNIDDVSQLAGVVILDQ